jgi:hypothetical protein
MKIMLKFLFHSEIFRLSTFNLKSIIENLTNDVILRGFKFQWSEVWGKKTKNHQFFIFLVLASKQKYKRMIKNKVYLHIWFIVTVG